MYFVLSLCVILHSACSLTLLSPQKHYFLKFSLIIWSLFLLQECSTEHLSYRRMFQKVFLSSCSRCTLTCIASADPPLDGRCLLFRRAIALQKDSGSGVPIVSVTGSQLRCSNIPLLAGKKTWGSRNKFGVFFKAGSVSMVVYSC